MMLYIRYYLHELFPRWFKAPQVAMARRRVIQEAKITARYYLIESQSTTSVISYLNQLGVKGYPELQETLVGQMEARAKISLPADFGELPNPPAGVRVSSVGYEQRDELAKMYYQLVDWKPK